MTILQLVYDFNKYDHVTCMHLHHPLYMTISSMIPIDITSCASRLSLYKYYFFIILWLLFKFFILIFHYIVIHNIVSPYKLIKP